MTSYFIYLLQVKVVISVTIGLTLIVITVSVFLYKKYCSTRRNQAITLTNFDGNTSQRIIEDCPTSLSDEERQFDELVDEYQRVRQADQKSNSGMFSFYLKLAT